MPLLVYAAPFGAYIGPVALGFLPLPPQHYHLGILGMALALWLAQDNRMNAVREPSLRQRVVTGACIVAATCLALWVSHPSQPLFWHWRQLPHMQGIALTLAMYGCLMLPGALWFGLLYPWNALRHCLRALGACTLLGMGFIAAGVFSAAYHASLAGPALTLAGWLLRLVDSGATQVDPHTFVIAFRGFATRVGPQCAALDGVVLFILLAYACWHYRSAQYPLRAVIVGAACACLLFLANGIRIAGIMIIGSYDRMLGMELFHGVAGMLLVLGAVWIFDKLALAPRRR